MPQITFNDKKYNFRQFYNHTVRGRRIGEKKLTELDKEIIIWLIKSKIKLSKIARFSRLHLTSNYIKQNNEITSRATTVQGQEGV